MREIEFTFKCLRSVYLFGCTVCTT